MKIENLVQDSHFQAGSKPELVIYSSPGVLQIAVNTAVGCRVRLTLALGDDGRCAVIEQEGGGDKTEPKA